jgi:tetratricopeptide (TPR) repeat protein
VLQSVAIDVYRRGGFTQLVLAAKRDYAEQYGLTAPFWAHRKAQDLPLVVRELKQNLQDLAAYYHEQAQKTKGPEAYQEAAHWYREFLGQFPDDPAAAETDYLLADSLFESHQYGDAATEYLHTGYDRPGTPRAAAAAYAAVVSFEKQLASTASADRTALRERSLLEAYRFAKTFPEHPESGPVLVRTARERLEDHQYAQALTIAQTATSRQPELPALLLRDAWMVSATCEFELGHFDRAEKAGIEARQRMTPADPARAATDERLAASVYRQG